MSRFFNISLTGGTAAGPYAIYYDNVIAGNLCLLYPSGLPATGLTLTQLQLGVQIEAPDNITSIIIYNQRCDVFEIINIGSAAPILTRFCLSITNLLTGTIYYFEFVPTGLFSNGKPIYQATDGFSTYTLTWNSNNGYWQVPNLPLYTTTTARSTDNSSLPLTNWSLYGSSTYEEPYSVTAYSGSCVEQQPTYDVVYQKTDASCFGVNDGAVIVSAVGGYGGWVYSLDGIIYNNTTGIFTNLGSGYYNIYAKDISGTTTQIGVYVDGSSPLIAPLPLNIIDNIYLGSSGNMKFYRVSFNIDTSQIPSGVSVNFDYRLIYSFSYTEPGTVTFDTTQHVLTINGVGQTIGLNDSSALTVVASSACNPIYKKYGGYDEYRALSMSVTNSDTVIGYAIYGIDTDTGGQYVEPCITLSNMSINMVLDNISTNSPCVSMAATSINISENQTLTIVQ